MTICLGLNKIGLNKSGFIKFDELYSFNTKKQLRQLPWRFRFLRKSTTINHSDIKSIEFKGFK